MIDAVKSTYGLILWLVLTAASVARAGAADDWPQFLGPTRDNVCPGTGLADRWPKEGPAALWKSQVGQGFSGPVVSGGKLILFHRVGADEVVECLAADTGERKWSSKYPTGYRDDFGFDEGPRATPAIAGGRVFTYGAEGKLHCWELDTGNKRWTVDVKKTFNTEKGFFGIACSPLVEGDAVILNVGGRDGAGVVAFDADTGKVRWKATNDEASYASPVAATVHRRRTVFALTRAGLAALDAADGAVRFSFPWRSRSDSSVNAATPLVVGDLVFLSASYGTGAVVLRVTPEGKAEEVWSGDESLSNHYATSVHRGGFLYGFDGRQEFGPRLRCVEMQTGKVRWGEHGFGAGTLMVAGERLLVLKETGDLVMAPASPEKFAPTGRAKILEGQCRAHPALAGGLFYARDKTTLVCVDLRGAGDSER